MIQNLGTVQNLKRASDSAQIRIQSGFHDLQSGESVAVNGTCLTATHLEGEGHAVFFASAETLSKTNIGDLREGSRVNLERALRLQDRLSGHIVQGHVDGRGRLAQILKAGENFQQGYEIPSVLLRYCVEKGSITINGVSLTINSIRINQISVHLIPHTWNHTNLSQLHEGDSVNVEVDVLAKYVESLCRN